MSAIIWASLSELEQYVGLSLLMAGVSFLLIISLIRDMTEGDPIPFLYVPFIALGIFGSIYSLTLYFRRKKEIDDYNHGYYYGQKPPT